MALLFRNFRINEGLTQEDLSRLSGLHVNTIANIERAKGVKGFNIFSLIQCLDAMDISLKDFFGDIE